MGICACVYPYLGLGSVSLALWFQVHRSRGELNPQNNLQLPLGLQEVPDPLSTLGDKAKKQGSFLPVRSRRGRACRSRAIVSKCRK